MKISEILTKASNSWVVQQIDKVVEAVGKTVASIIEIDWKFTRTKVEESPILVGEWYRSRHWQTCPFELNVTDKVIVLAAEDGWVKVGYNTPSREVINSLFQEQEFRELYVYDQRDNRHK